MSKMLIGVAILTVLVLVVVIGLALLAWQSRRMQPSVGLVAGQLQPCASAGICRCSEYGDVPTWPIDGDSAAAWNSLLALLEQDPQLNVVTKANGYVHATAHTSLFGFVDDVEARLDSGLGLIHVRSASRVGGSDLGANAARLEALRNKWLLAVAP